MKRLNNIFQNKLQTLLESAEPLSRNCDPNLTINEHVYAICCRPEGAGGVSSGGNVKPSERYAAINFEAARFSSLWENQNQPFA